LNQWVVLDGSQTVLDQDEFDALELEGETRRQAEAGLRELEMLFADYKKPGLDERSGFCLIDENNARQPGFNTERIQYRPAKSEQQPDHTDTTAAKQDNHHDLDDPRPGLTKS
jgi:hypothetical protein